MAKDNAVGQQDGQLAFWIDDVLIGDYRPGYPDGPWLRDQFHTDGCSFSACTDPQPFEGFDFRSDDDVRFKRVFLDAYYERGTFESKKAALEAMGLAVSDEQTSYYDDVVVATERSGCRVPNDESLVVRDLGDGHQRVSGLLTWSDCVRKACYDAR